MAENSTGDKSEKASAQKLKKSREEGQVVRSRDLATALGILVTLKLFIWLLPSYMLDFRELFHQSFATFEAEGALENTGSTIFATAMWLLIKMIVPLFVVPLAIVLGGLVPGGWVFSSKHWEPKLERFSPVTNLGRLFSGKHWFEFGLSVAKSVVLCWVLVHVATSTLADYTRLQSLPLNEALLSGSRLMLDGLMALVSVFIMFAIIDVPAQAFFFAKNQRMSKQDLKEEYKSNEGRPEVRNRIRQLQRAMSQRAARKTVPNADVVIVNPEHYAVALKYDEQRAEAPFVLAKGVDEMALYIRQIAEEHKIEVLALPPLARAIYNTSQVNQQIPVQLYQAVSQVLNYVLQLQAFRAGRRNVQPAFPNEVAVPASMSEVPPA
ncbi:EscU/YscU/HrcU family type III secretion system export apparatus switch protein [Pseudoduganella namucuonensis]|uniref:Flagellar biosynthetic protein FlhB n=1 Tax=Pseudoduganella namucuonensis TaxID=1035707 RepID=A0A1I7HT58_9BURK|nr:flagellar type III secretion system protein FlhB [Pseudoduganella namucuonensis]SFU63887.1 flagellar biosynthetic protein FlhB [Pseudoduganella namucuonensis]